MQIPYTKPSITQLEIDYATDAAANGWGANCYNYINRFEREFSEYIGVKYAVATSSCTGAMTLGLNALGISQGDEVILADTNWIATASPIVHSGATPVFVDILPDTWCIDPIKAEQAITERTKAIVATHLYGNLCDMDRLLEICRRHKIILIEDAAEAIGSFYRGRAAGSMGKFATFSFHGTKTMTTGEGGMFTTADAELFEHVLTLSNHGRARFETKQFWASAAGFKFKMSNIQAAIGCAQLSRIEELVNRKKEIMSSYRELFSDISDIKLNPEMFYAPSGYWMPNVVFDEKTQISTNDIIPEFKRSGIDARVFFWPLSSLPMFKTATLNVNSYSIARRSINLPSYHDMTELNIHFVSEVLHRFWEKSLG